MKQDDSIMDELYTAWCVAEFEANCIYDELDEDFTHPRFIHVETQPATASCVVSTRSRSSGRYRQSHSDPQLRILAARIDKSPNCRSPPSCS